MDVLIWAIAVAAFIIIEIATVQLVSVWFAAGALITLMCTYFFELSMLQQVGIFVISSAVLVALTFPYLKSRRSKKHIGTNIELDMGRVTLGGVDWSAQPLDHEQIIPKGSIVTVEEVQGAKLVVSQKTN